MEHYLLLKFEPDFWENENIYELACETFNGLKAELADILDVEVRKNIVDRPSNAELMIRMTLTGKPALSCYLEHPLHKSFVKKICVHELNRITFDCE